LEKNGVPRRQQLGAKLIEGGLVCLPARPNHQIARRLMPLDLAPPDLPQAPAQTIAGHRGRLELGDDQSHPWLARFIVDPDHVQVLEAATPAMAEAAANVGRAREPMGSRQARRWRQEPPCFEGKETVSRFRPFFRLRDNTARPQRVAIRARNPCLLIRRLFRGRYDGFIRAFLQNEPWKLAGPRRWGQGDGDGEEEKRVERKRASPGWKKEWKTLKTLRTVERNVRFFSFLFVFSAVSIFSVFFCQDPIDIFIPHP